ncbi:winged helix-turn-helix domain-containing protein [Streptosporangium sp. NPDC051022]|uniref:winged helix-turn-helix domain-containing protein n=1 Tax=Streptosporangium sp. NPDC051022 TaxID=3155752 RepID=UPI003436E667
MIVIDPYSPEPVYRQLARLLRDAIDRGEYGPGQMLPAEGRLAQIYEVGRDTVRDALDVLRSEGRVDTTRGARTRVRADQGKADFDLPSGGRVDGRMPTLDERERWGLRPGVPLLEITSRDGAKKVVPADRFTLVVPE